MSTFDLEAALKKAKAENLHVLNEADFELGYRLCAEDVGKQVACGVVCPACFFVFNGNQTRLDAPVQQEPVAWKHNCNALCVNDLELWTDRCPHCGKPRQNPASTAVEQPPAEVVRELVEALDQIHDEARARAKHKDGVNPTWILNITQNALTKAKEHGL